MSAAVLAVDARDLHKQMQIVKETVRREIQLLEDQIAKSRAARSASPFAPASLSATPRQGIQQQQQQHTTTTISSSTAALLNTTNSPSPIPPLLPQPTITTTTGATGVALVGGEGRSSNVQGGSSTLGPVPQLEKVLPTSQVNTLKEQEQQQKQESHVNASSTIHNSVNGIGVDRVSTGVTSTSPQREGNVGVSTKESPFHRTKLAAAQDASSPSPPPVPRSPSYSSSQQRDLEARSKTGYLLHLVKSRFSEKFVQHFIVASEERDGIAWYENEKDAERQQRELGFIPFYAETRNSRGSRFKKAAVCWPLILEEDCSKAKDPNKTYFAVEYYTETPGKMDGRYEKLVFATDNVEERNEWVFFLTKYVGLYLVPREESEELQSLPRGAEKPVHESIVLDGEAPGGNIR